MLSYKLQNGILNIGLGNTGRAVAAAPAIRYGKGIRLYERSLNYRSNYRLGNPIARRYGKRHFAQID